MGDESKTYSLVQTIGCPTGVEPDLPYLLRQLNLTEDNFIIKLDAEPPEDGALLIPDTYVWPSEITLQNGEKKTVDAEFFSLLLNCIIFLLKWKKEAKSAAQKKGAAGK
jgi:hypothetical protein